MSTSETIGMFFYYAHNLAQQACESALDKVTANQAHKGAMLPAHAPAPPSSNGLESGLGTVWSSRISDSRRTPAARSAR